MKLIGFYDYTVILTYLSLICAGTGMVMASSGRFDAAIWCLLFSGFCDAFDGIVARSKKNRTEDEKSFGIQIDSLCDAISFGVFPAVLCYHMGMDGVLGVAILILFCLCGVIRLAFFNVMETRRQQTCGGINKAYRGLPITSSSILLPLTCLLRPLMDEGFFAALLHGVMALMSILFVLDFSVKKPDWLKILHLSKS